VGLSKARASPSTLLRPISNRVDSGRLAVRLAVGVGRLLPANCEFPASRKVPRIAMVVPEHARHRRRVDASIHPAAQVFADPGVYLDYAATTPVDPAVSRVMGGFLTKDGTFGNPASVTHGFGQAAADAVENARLEVAALVSSRPEEIVWTSGATEAINLAMKGSALARGGRGRHIVTSPLEHRAVLDSAEWLESQGFEIGYVEPDDDGGITRRGLLRVLRPDTVLVSLMLVNNETGTITDVAALGSLLREQGALFHVDAVQGAARLRMDDIATAADLVSISGHKIYGPKGIGALRVRRPLLGELVPQTHGGGHELGLRSGTLPTHQIVGMGAAAKLAREHGEADAKHVTSLDRKLRAYLDRISGASLNGSTPRRVPGILNVHFADVAAEALMIGLGNVAISSGSACTSAEIMPSHVLLALGLGEERAFSSVRFSFGRFTTMDEIDHVGRLLAEVVPALRRLSQ